MHSCAMATEAGPQEAALRKLPVNYSLALRLRDAGVAPEIVCEYLGIEQNTLPAFYRVAEEKLAAAEGRLSPEAQPHCVHHIAAD